MDSGPVKAKGNEPAPQSTYHDRRTAKENPAPARAGTDHGVKLLGRQPARALSRRSEQQVDDKALQLSAKFLKLFAADPFVAPQSLADKVAELQEQAEQEHESEALQAQEARFESARLWAVSEFHMREASRLKTLAEKLGDLIDPAA